MNADNDKEIKRPIVDTRIGQFPSRLGMVIEQQEGGIRSFAKKANVSDTSIRKYLYGDSEPKLSILIALADAANVTVEWLATGQGPMQRDSNNIFEKTDNVDIEDLFISTVIAASIQIEEEPEELYPPEILSRAYLDILKISVKKKGVYGHIVKSILDGYASEFFVPYRDRTIESLINATSLPEEKTEFLKDQYWYNLLEEKFGDIVKPYPRKKRDEMIEFLRSEIQKMESKSTSA